MNRGRGEETFLRKGFLSPPPGYLFSFVVGIESLFGEWGGKEVFLSWLCYKKWLTLFSLKFQRDDRQNALAAAPARGKTGKEAVCSTALWR